jgi:precorrin-2 dehydrogenase / sirohydrochlorin ferrochelatase
LHRPENATSLCYPVALCLEGKRCLVAGGGSLAAEKVEGLLRAGGNVVVVAPEVAHPLRHLAERGEIELRERAYEPADLSGVYLAYGASEDRALNARVATDAREAGVLVNAVDDIPNCDFFAVSLVRRGDLQVAISTNGLSPALARWMREYLDAQLPDALGELLTALAGVRADVREAGAVPPYDRWRAAIDLGLSALQHGENRRYAADRIRAVLLGNDPVELLEADPAPGQLPFLTAAGSILS